MQRAEYALLALVLGTSGCSSDDSDGGKTAPTLDGLVHSWVVDEKNAPVPDVEVCVEGEPDIPCVMTDAKGIADLAVPKDKELVLTYAKPEFVTKRRQIFSNEYKSKGLGIWALQRKSWYDQVATDLGSPAPFDYDKGIAALLVGTGPAEEFIINADHTGTTFDLQPVSGPKDPNIKELKFQVAGDLTLTGCISGCTDGVVGYADVPPGKYRAVFSAPKKTCTASAFACADGTPSCVELEIVAGVNTFASMLCE